jgi:Na+-transporting methylmalonyl-CoA/oxaloacetate decarboxylase gamma subunit
MQFMRIDFWPAGLVLAVAFLLVMAMRSLERFARSRTVKRTHQALQRAVGDPSDPKHDE